MTLNAINPLQAGSPGQVVQFLELATQHDLSSEQRESAERIIGDLDDKATIADFVAAATQTAELNAFAERVRGLLEQGVNYRHIFEEGIADIVLDDAERKIVSS